MPDVLKSITNEQWAIWAIFSTFTLLILMITYAMGFKHGEHYAEKMLKQWDYDNETRKRYLKWKKDVERHN